MQIMPKFQPTNKVCKCQGLDLITEAVVVEISGFSGPVRVIDTRINAAIYEEFLDLLEKFPVEELVAQETERICIEQAESGLIRVVNKGKTQLDQYFYFTKFELHHLKENLADYRTTEILSRGKIRLPKENSESTRPLRVTFYSNLITKDMKGQTVQYVQDFYTHNLILENIEGLGRVTGILNISGVKVVYPSLCESGSYERKLTADDWKSLKQKCFDGLCAPTVMTKKYLEETKTGDLRY